MSRIDDAPDFRLEPAYPDARSGPWPAAPGDDLRSAESSDPLWDALQPDPEVAALRPDADFRPAVARRGAAGGPRAGRGRRAALMGGAMAAVAALLLAGPRPDPVAPVAAVISPAPVELAVVAPLVAPAPTVPASGPNPVAQAPVADSKPLRLARVPPPPARPRAPMVTVSTRNVTLVEAPASGLLTLVKAPLPRPARVAETARIATPDLDTGRPIRRPTAAHAQAAPKPVVKAAPATAAEAGTRPPPRPNRPVAPVRVASLSPTPAEMALAAQLAVPPSRPAAPKAAPALAAAAPATVVPAPAPRAAAPARAAKPVAKAAAKPVVRSTPPRVVRGPSPAAIPVKTVKAAPAAPTMRVASQAPMRVVAVPTKPAKPVASARPQAKVAALAQPVAPRKPAASQRTASRKPAVERSGLSRGNVSLLGVFSGDDGRHALLLLPDGSIERVRPGDRVAGGQVAAIDTDTVRLSGSGRDTVLRLPD